MSTTRENPEAQMRLGGWSLYFLAKFLLYWRDLIGFHPLENLAFAALLAAPLRPGPWHRLRKVLAVPASLALLYYDSRLPGLGRLLSQSSLVSDFSASYLLELAGRFVNLEILALLVLAWAVLQAVRPYLRVGVLVMAGLVFLTVQGTVVRAPVVAATLAPSSPGMAPGTALKEDPDTILTSFYASEAQRRTRLPVAAAGAPPFDIIILHICSLSWDDLVASGLDKHPLWQRMDLLFKRFNTASSYSGPAAIRINRAMCGQKPHSALYEGAGQNCYLMPSLREAGFASNLAMNHDGHFDDFLPTLRLQGVDAPLQSLAGTPIPQRAFDNSPIYDDSAVLTRWLEARGKDASPRVALYYNSISLHDGNRIMAGPNAKLGSVESYKPRLAKLLDDLNAFLQKMEAAGRRAVVMVVPEHGAAIRGDKYQFSGLRDIATPRITTVPVGVAVIGPDAKRLDGPAVIERPSSYFALSALMSRMIETPPYSDAGFSAQQYAEKLPETRHVTENDAATVVDGGSTVWMRLGKEPWEPYTTN